MQNWKKLGLIIKPLGNENLSFTHCQPPTILKKSDNVYRVYFGSRDRDNISQIFYNDIDLDNLKITSSSETPILCKGEIGFFDQHGIYPSSIIKKDGQIYLYTIGYKKGAAPLFYMKIGLSISLDDGHSFKKYSNAPLLPLSDHDPCMITGPCVMEDNGRYRMWYVSGYKWDQDTDGNLQSHYHIKYAESEDGINWKREGLISIDLVHPGETNIARPWILKEDGIYKAWYSYACGKEGYRIGYAESTDGGYTFERMDHLAGITTSDEPWENEAVAYPAVISHKGRKYMFYNGNKFGKDGIALAVEEKE
jgi:hypothetical protein